MWLKLIKICLNKSWSTSCVTVIKEPSKTNGIEAYHKLSKLRETLFKVRGALLSINPLIMTPLLTHIHKEVQITGNSADTGTEYTKVNGSHIIMVKDFDN